MPSPALCAICGLIYIIIAIEVTERQTKIDWSQAKTACVFIHQLMKLLCAAHILYQACLYMGGRVSRTYDNVNKQHSYKQR